MNKINLNKIQVFAHHGCWPEEEIIGGEYFVDISIDLDFLQAAAADDLSKTADYVVVKEIVCIWRTRKITKSKMIWILFGRELRSWGTDIGDVARRLRKFSQILNLFKAFIANEKTGTIYVIIFEAPTEEWEATWKIAEPMLKYLFIDDTI